jgi:hypothetical protein
MVGTREGEAMSQPTDGKSQSTSTGVGGVMRVTTTAPDPLTLAQPTQQEVEAARSWREKNAPNLCGPDVNFVDVLLAAYQKARKGER